MLTKYEKFVYRFSNWLANAGVVFLIAVFIISVVDVIGTKALNMPVPGVTELVGYFELIFISLAIGLTQILKQHISVDIFTSRLPKRAQMVLALIISLILVVLFAVLIWQSIRLGFIYQERGQYSINLRMPFSDFAFVMAFAFISPVLIFILDTLKSVKELSTK